MKYIHSSTLQSNNKSKNSRYDFEQLPRIMPAAEYICLKSQANKSFTYFSPVKLSTVSVLKLEGGTIVPALIFA